MNTLNSCKLMAFIPTANLAQKGIRFDHKKSPQN